MLSSYPFLPPFRRLCGVSSHTLPLHHPSSIPLRSRPLVFIFSSLSLLSFVGGAFLQHLLVRFTYLLMHSFIPRLYLVLI